MTFKQYLKQHLEEDTMVGDLARDAFKDPEWKGKSSASSLEACLVKRRTCAGAWEAFEMAKAEYEELRGS